MGRCLMVTLYMGYDALRRAAQHCGHLTGGSLRHFRAFSTLEQNPAFKVLSTPTTRK